MLTEYTINELTDKMLKSKEQYKIACWYATVNVHNWSDNEIDRFSRVFLKSAYSKESDCINWNCTLILHFLPWIEDNCLADDMSMELSGYLNSDSEKAISYVAETIARANYLLSEKAILQAADFVSSVHMQHYDYGTLQNITLLGWGIIDFCPPKVAEKLKEACLKIEERMQLRLYKSDHLNQHEDIIFYVSDYLSGKSFLQPPVAEIYAATMLGKIGCSSVIFDNRLYHYSVEHFIRLVRERGIKTVVVDTTPYDQVSIYYVDYRLNRIVYDIKKMRENGLTVICIGSHATVRPIEFLNMTGVQYAIKGDAELTLLKLAEYSKHFKELHMDEGSPVPNVYYWKDGKIQYSGDDSETQKPDISVFPMPDYDYVDIDGYYGDEYVDNEHRIKAAWGGILAQRGCPFHCGFCFNFFGRKVRSRTPIQVVDEMEMLEKKYNVQHFFFMDYTFTANKQWVKEVCDLICERKLTIKWNCETRVDCLDEEILDFMKRANCKRIWLGVETFNNDLLMNANKGINEEQIISMIHKILENGIKVSCFLMIGLPGENIDTIEHNFEQIQKSGIEYTKSIITFVPRDGTALYELVSRVNTVASFYDMNRYKGILENDISEENIIAAIEQMSNRDVYSWKIRGGK